MPARRWFLLAILWYPLAGLVACQDSESLPTAPEVAVLASTQSGEGLEDDLATLARGLARSTGAPSVRRVVIQEMRRSPLGKHRVAVSGFLQADRGAEVRAGIAFSLGLSEGQVRGLLAGLPRLDLYVPLRKHRRNWTGPGGGAVVYTIEDAPSKVDGFGFDGSSRQFRSFEEVSAEPVVIALRLAAHGTRDPRAVRQPDRPGATIQDSDDGDVTVRMEYRDGDGKLIDQGFVSRVRQEAGEGSSPARTPVQCVGPALTDPCGGGGGGGTSLLTYLEGTCVNFDDGVAILGIDDNVEIRLEGRALDGTTTLETTSWYGEWPEPGSFGGEYSCSSHLPIIFFSSWEPHSQGLSFVVDMTETDMLAPDDYKGFSTWPYGASGSTLPYATLSGEVTGFGVFSW